MTTYRVGGNAALFVIAARDEDLRRVGEAAAETALPVLVIGNGSNLLIADAGFPGICVALGPSYAGLRVDARSGRVRVGGGASLPVVARRLASRALRGFEWAVGVPGTLGGAVRMNAGGHGSDIAACLVSCDVLDLCSGELGEVSVADLRYGYRRSVIDHHQVVVGGELQCVAGSRAEAEALIAEIVRWRRDNQPGGQNAGSVFTNPVGDTAGRLIEAAGLKDLRVGSAQVSPKHANFIQADDGGSADDILRLMDQVRSAVAARCGIELATEIHLIGFPGTYPY